MRHGLFDDSTAVDIDGHVMTIPRSHDYNYAFLNWGVRCLHGFGLEAGRTMEAISFTKQVARR